MKSATERLIELAEGLNPTGEIGDGKVARFHELAAQARLERHRAAFPAVAEAWERAAAIADDEAATHRKTLADDPFDEHANDRKHARYRTALRIAGNIRLEAGLE